MLFVNFMYHVIKFFVKLQTLYHYTFVNTYRNIYHGRIISVDAILVRSLNKKSLYRLGWFKHSGNVMRWLAHNAINTFAKCKRPYIPPITFVNNEIPEADFYQVSLWNGKKRIVRSVGCGYIRMDCNEFVANNGINNNGINNNGIINNNNGINDINSNNSNKNASYTRASHAHASHASSYESKKLLHASIGGKDVTDFVNSYDMTFTKYNKITAKELFMMAIIFKQIPRQWHGPIETEIIMCDEIIETSWLKDSDIVYIYGE